jgi:hypothetical protein
LAEEAALAMAWGLLGNEEEEDHWQVRTTHRMFAARDLVRREHNDESSVMS